MDSAQAITHFLIKATDLLRCYNYLKGAIVAQVKPGEYTDIN